MGRNPHVFNKEENLMKNTFTKIAVLTVGLFSVSAFADTAGAFFNSTVSSYCTVGQVTPGVMHLADDKSISTDTTAEVRVSNNEGGKYKVSIANPSGFNSTPASFSGTATLAAKFTSTGANATAQAITAVGDHPLANQGTDNLAVTIEGTSDTDFVAGSYGAVAMVTCDAQ